MGQDRIKSWVLSNQSKSKLIKYIRWFRTWCCCFCLCLPNKPTIMKILYIYIYITYVTSLRIKTKSGKTDKNQKSSSFPVLWWFRFLKPRSMVIIELRFTWSGNSSCWVYVPLPKTQNECLSWIQLAKI